MKSVLVRAACYLAFFCCFPFPVNLAAETIRVAIVYPEVNRPYSAVFEQIISGIEAQKGIRIKSRSISNDDNAAAVSQWVNRQKADALIALGRQGVKIADTLDIDIPIIVGAILYISDPDSAQTTGISLTPDPYLLFKHLKQLAPNVTKIHVVYNPNRYTWLIERAKKAAKKYDLEIVTATANSLSESAHIHRKILHGSEHNKDAIWLLQDSSIVGESSVLPFILKEAWRNKLLVFSSNPGHVRRGALFALFADRQALGRSIANLVMKYVSKGDKSVGLVPLSDVQIAVNVRTAGHIDLTIPYEQQRKFDLIFPKR